MTTTDRTDLQLTTVPPVEVAMLVRRPAAEVFRAFADPEVTTRFWFTSSTGPLTPGAKVKWEWSFYDITADVTVRDVEPDRRLVFDWDDDPVTTVEIRFTARPDGTTLVEVTETGYAGNGMDGDGVAAHLAGSTGGFTNVLCALKAWLEHGIELGTVRDRYPDGMG